MSTRETQLDTPITEIIRRRYSCRTYDTRPISQVDQEKLARYVEQAGAAPFGSEARFSLIAATEEDTESLAGLGTYGFIRNPAGFIAGAVRQAEHDMEDFGYLMERIILYATGAGLGTCWLGGTFRKSNFADKIGLLPGESLPAVTSVGYGAAKPSAAEWLIRKGAGSHKRIPWEGLFYKRDLNSPIERIDAGAFETPLEMVRLAPSASNRQPWRVVLADGAWHFYLRRRSSFRRRGAASKASRVDLPRVDMGIAMCHFELAATAQGLHGSWKRVHAGGGPADGQLEYTATWVGAGS